MDNQKNFTIFEKHSIYAKQKDPSENDGSFFLTSMQKKSQFLLQIM